MDVQPDANVKARFGRRELKAFGLAGFGFLQAIEGNVDEADDAAHQIVERHPRSVDALLLGAEVLCLTGKSDEAEGLVREHMESVSGPGSSVSSEWMRDALLPYYTKDWEDQKLVNFANNSPYRGQCLSYAYWTIALRHFSEGDVQRATENFRK